MNENVDLTKILENCPEGWEFWSDNYGKVQFLRINRNLQHPIIVRRTNGSSAYYTKEGWCHIEFPASCLLWPSKDCRDWSKFTAPWYKKEKFDPKTLQPFDKVLGFFNGIWNCDLYSNYNVNKMFPYVCFRSSVSRIIPYNDDTKHLVGTTEEAPQYYRYWED